MELNMFWQALLLLVTGMLSVNHGMKGGVRCSD